MSELEFWKDLGNIFDAVMNYQKKNVEFNNRFINPWIRLGNVFERQDQANDAVQAYKRATEIDPNTVQNWVELGDAQFKKGEYDQAIEAYSQAVTLDPEAGWPLGNLALSLVNQGRVEEAIPLYMKSIDLLTEVEDKAICWNRLGNAYRKLNDYENAFFAFQKADQLDGDNTGFSDKLDETPPSMPMVAPEEILEQMVVDQPLEEGEAELVAVEAVNEAVEEFVQPEAESPTADAMSEATDEPLALKPNMEMVVEEDAAQDEIASSLDEVHVEQIHNENTDIEEETPLTLHEKKLNLIEIVESVIAKVERTYAEQKTSIASEEQEVEEVLVEAEASSTCEETVQEVETVNPESAEMVQEVETVNLESAETAQEVEAVNAVNEETIQESGIVQEAIAEQEVEATNAAVEESVQEIKSLTETSAEAAPEAESADVSEAITSEAVAAPVCAEEPTPKAQSAAIETEAQVEAKVETPAAETTKDEEQVKETVPQRIPEWLIMKAMVKPEEQESVSEPEAQQELSQIESVVTLSDISSEAAVSESDINMDVVETYTDPLAAQLMAESDLSDEAAQSEAAADQAGSQDDVEVKSEEPVTVNDSEPVAETSLPEELPAVDVEDSPTVVAEERTAESAYEEYLKDAAEPVNHLNDHTDEVQSEAPVTRVSKNGEVRIAMDTKNAHVWNELGNIYLNTGTYDDAIASYSKAIELDRNFAWPYSNLALAYVQKGRFAEAILLYQRGIELFTSDRDKAITWNRLGNVYRRVNDYTNAIASYQTADELDPENTTLSLRASFGLLGNMFPDSKPAYVS